MLNLEVTLMIVTVMNFLTYTEEIFSPSLVFSARSQSKSTPAEENE